MNVNVRRARLDDAVKISKVHCSNVEKWYKRVRSGRVESTYEKLTLLERWEHGGPWMSVETCAIHLNYLLINSQHPIVAEVDGVVVGELELYVGQEAGILGRTGFIDVLEVHRRYRGRGIGRTLVEAAAEIAHEEGCETLSVWPNREAIGFYYKCGLSKRAYSVIHVALNLEGFRVTESRTSRRWSEIPYRELERSYFVTPRIFSSYATWLKGGWSYAVEREMLREERGYVEDLGLLYALESLWRNLMDARATMWVEDVASLDEALGYVCGRARALGFNRLHLYVSENLYKKTIERLPHTRICEKVVLMMRL